MRMRGILLSCLLVLVPLAGARAETVDDGTALELRMLFEQLIESVLDDDAAAVDEVTCLDDLLHARLRREEALGLVADAGDPVLVQDRKSKARDAVWSFVEWTVWKGWQVESTDASRIAVHGAEGETEMLAGEAGELRITAAGILGVKMLTSTRAVDVEVFRLGERWCLDPLSMQ